MTRVEALALYREAKGQVGSVFSVAVIGQHEPYTVSLMPKRAQSPSDEKVFTTRASYLQWLSINVSGGGKTIHRP